MHEKINFELTREEYNDIIRCLKPGMFQSFHNSITRGVKFADNGQVALICRIDEEPATYYQRAVISGDYTEPTKPTIRIEIDNWEKMQALCDIISAASKIDKN